MTVADLIAELQKMPGYLEVAVRASQHESREIEAATFEGRYVELRYTRSQRARPQPMKSTL